jgi:TPR repeat protein
LKQKYHIILEVSLTIVIIALIDFEKAIYWLKKAHAKGVRTATYLLGTIYEEGLGISVDVPRAIRPLAFGELGLMLAVYNSAWHNMFCVILL